MKLGPAWAESFTSTQLENLAPPVYQTMAPLKGTPGSHLLFPALTWKDAGSQDSSQQSAQSSLDAPSQVVAGNDSRSLSCPPQVPAGTSQALFDLTLSFPTPLFWTIWRPPVALCPAVSRLFSPQTLPLPSHRQLTLNLLLGTLCFSGHNLLSLSLCLGN